MVSSKKKQKSDGVNSLNTRSPGSKTKKKTPNKANLKDAAKNDREIHEISESSSSDSAEQARRDEPKESNGVVLEDAKVIRFPMNRIRRIMRSENNSAPQIIMQDAVFLVNKATGLRPRASAGPGLMWVV